MGNLTPAPAGIGHNGGPPLNIAIQSWHTFVASLPPDTRMTLARLVYDISVGAVGTVNALIVQLMPQIPFVRGIVIKASQSAADSVIQTLAGLLEKKLEAGQ